MTETLPVWYIVGTVFCMGLQLPLLPRDKKGVDYVLMCVFYMGLSFSWPFTVGLIIGAYIKGEL